jgi:hypothetical protein
VLFVSMLTLIFTSVVDIEVKVKPE